MSTESRFADALAKASSGSAAFEALNVLVQEVVGAKLVTVMVLESHGTLARRTFSTMPEAYPVSGSKPVVQDAWSERVLARRETFIANRLDEIANVFPDHELIGALGCGSVINLPIVLAGRTLGTLNLLDVEGYFTPERVTRVEERLRLPALAARLAWDAEG